MKRPTLRGASGERPAERRSNGRQAGTRRHLPRPSLRRVRFPRLPFRRLVVPVLATALLLAVLVVGVFPTRSYLAQRRAIASADANLQSLSQTNDTLQAQVDRLQTNQEIESQAREHYGLVFPGEEAYHVLPDPQDPLKVPDVWPFSRLQQRLDR